MNIRLIPAAVAAAALMLCLALPIADLSSAEGVDNDQGTVTYYTYTVDFQFHGTDAQWIHWDFGFTRNGSPVTSDEWNPQGIEFPGKGTYTVTQTVGNTVGTYVSVLRINIMGTPEVTFDSNGGSDVPVQIVKAGNKATPPSNPIRDGYTFSGWYKEMSLLNRFSFDQPVSQHMTLYAKWTPIQSGNGPGDDDGKDTEPSKDTDGTEEEKAEAFALGSTFVSLAVFAVGAVVAYFGNRSDNRTLRIAGIVIALAAGVCLVFDVDLLGLLNIGGE